MSRESKRTLRVIAWMSFALSITAVITAILVVPIAEITIAGKMMLLAAVFLVGAIITAIASS